VTAPSEGRSYFVSAMILSATDETDPYPLGFSQLSAFMPAAPVNMEGVHSVSRALTEDAHRTGKLHHALRYVVLSWSEFGK
jgi:hypothetical protein